MALYEIDIHRTSYDVPVDMQTIYMALENANIQIDKDERRGNIHGIAVENEQPEYVYVDASQVGQAVQVINGLGYETDEDDTEDEDN